MKNWRLLTTWRRECSSLFFISVACLKGINLHTQEFCQESMSSGNIIQSGCSAQASFQLRNTAYGSSNVFLFIRKGYSVGKFTMLIVPSALNMKRVVNFSVLSPCRKPWKRFHFVIQPFPPLAIGNSPLQIEIAQNLGNHTGIPQKHAPYRY